MTRADMEGDTTTLTALTQQMAMLLTAMTNRAVFTGSSRFEGDKSDEEKTIEIGRAHV